jgi:hypothetical protein
MGKPVPPASRAPQVWLALLDHHSGWEPQGPLGSPEPQASLEQPDRAREWLELWHGRMHAH